MSYSRNGASDRNRTNDTGIFSPLLYQLSYLGKSFSAPKRRGWGIATPKGTHEMESISWEMATRNGLEPSTSSVTG